MSVKVGFVIPWYGEDIPGGAEALCRGLVKCLFQSGVQAEVLTTCVKQFTSDWSHNFHREGESIEGGVTVRRFRVRARDAARFELVNSQLMRNRDVAPEEELTFMTEMINSPGLYEFIAANQQGYVFLFLPYMFGTTYWGIRTCPERSILIPCLHDESYARMTLVRHMAESARGLVFNSAAEKRLAEMLYTLDSDRVAMLGAPVNCDWSADPQRFRRKYGLSNFFLYAGRTEKGKGADILVDYFCRYLEETGRAEQLVFIGGGELEIPVKYRSRIVKLGFVPTQDKYDAYAASIALCVPSVMESLSIVTMECWLAGRPVVVNAHCAVTSNFCRQSNGGLYFADYREFREILKLLADDHAKDQELCRGLGANGRQFVLENFQPRIVATRYRETLERWGFDLLRA